MPLRKEDKRPRPIAAKVEKFWDLLTAKCKKWQPWMTLVLAGFFLGNVAARISTSASSFLSDPATTGWAAAIASAGAAIAALTVARRAQEQSEKERREDRNHDEHKRHEDRAYAERLRQEDLARTRSERASEMTEAAARRKATAGIQMSVFAGLFSRARSAHFGIEKIMAAPAAADSQKEVRARINAMIGNIEALPIATAYDYDPNFGAHLSYISDWLRAMELSSRAWGDDNKRFVQEAVRCIGNGFHCIDPIIRSLQETYRDKHLTADERAGYVPRGIP